MADQKELHLLAEAIVHRQQEERQRNSKAPHYILNIGHTAVRELWMQHRMKAAPAGCPLGDVERIAWELSLLNDEALKAIKKQYEGASTNAQVCQHDRE